MKRTSSPKSEFLWFAAFVLVTPWAFDVIEGLVTR
jgi:hypothetical protein